MPSALILDHEAGATTVLAERTSGVPDTFWHKLQAEWGTSGRQPGVSVDVAISVFLTRLNWLASYCRRYHVQIDWRGDARALVGRRQENRRLLREALQRENTVDSQAVLDELEGGRFVRTLKSFQLRDLTQLLALAHGANFSVPGAGKTSVAYALHELLRIRESVEVMLVVSPVSAFEAWYEEAEESLQPAPKIEIFEGSISGSAEVLLVSYQRLASGYADLTDWLSSHASQMVVDEAHRMKRGWAGSWGRSCLNLAHLAVRRDILTGTPAPQSIDDLFALFEFLWPGEASDLLVSSNSQQPEAAAVARRIAPLYVRTGKSELQLQPPEIRIHAEEMGYLHAEIYRSLVGQYRGLFPLSRRGRVDMRRLGQVTMYLLEAATNPSLLAAGSHPHDPVRFRHPPLEIPSQRQLDDLLHEFASYEFPWKFRFLRELLAQNVSLGRKTLVWSNFVRNLETLFQHELKDYEPAMVHGGTSDRAAELDRFRTSSDCHVLLANPAATAEGISLHQVCHDAVYLERTYNAGQYLQSLDRIHRLGMDPSIETRVTVLSSVQTVDTLVDTSLREKTERMATLMDDSGLMVMSMPAPPEQGLEGDQTLGFEQADLAGLASHLQGNRAADDSESVS